MRGALCLRARVCACVCALVGCSFPGLYEALHHRVRGTWDHALWAQYLAYKSRSVAVPWDVTHGDVDAVKRQEMLDEIASRSGLSKDQMAVVDK